MDIIWYGLSCFRLTERGLATVVTDPFEPTWACRRPNSRPTSSRSATTPRATTT